ncbi:MAG: hypothetical protein JWN50_110 [Parcubacteria group bacterium]|nr:hypothetical protein [Parcubacteria group bacterium]
METLTKALKDIYEQFSDRGVLSLYIWGSMTRSDYRPGISDIDVLAIVGPETSIDDEQAIKEIIKAEYPELKNFHINFLYLDELTSGEGRGYLTKILPPGYLLEDFEHWQHVCGKEFVPSDFTAAWSNDEVIRFCQARVLGELDILEEFIEKNEQHYTVKAALVLCHNLHQRMHGKHQYNIDKLLERSTEETKDILPALLFLRAEDYKPDAVREHASLIREFVIRSI